MGSKITRKSCFTKPSEIVLLVAFFISVNLLILSYFQERTLRKLQHHEPDGRDKSSGSLETSDQTIEAGWEGQILTIEEDGRFGNLLLEIATLIIIGKRLNTPVQILPQVGRKLEKFLSHLPAPAIDYRKVGDGGKGDGDDVLLFCRPVSALTALTVSAPSVPSGPRSPPGPSWPTRATSPT